jgi:photosystem II stability/assembly factor-like uncharacterized protein
MSEGFSRKQMTRYGTHAVLAAVLALTWATTGLAKEKPLDYAIPSQLVMQTLLLDVTRAGERLVAVGEWGHVALSDDGGKTWRQAKSVPTRTTLTEVTFVDAKQGWCVGHEAVILHTSDGGENWELQFSAPDDDQAALLSVWFENAEHGIAVGAFGSMFETRDGGKKWEERDPLETEGEQPHLNHIFAGPKATLFIAAEFGSVFRSQDNGQSWKHIELPYDGSLWGGIPIDGDGVLIFGMRGHAFASHDLGESWETVETGTDQSLQSATRLRDGKIVMVGLGGVVATSTDGGRKFTAAIQPDRVGIAAVAEGADGTLLLFGETGLTKRTEQASAPQSSPQT